MAFSSVWGGQAAARRLRILIAFECRDIYGRSKSVIAFMNETMGAGVAGVIQQSIGFLGTGVVGGTVKELIYPYLNVLLEFTILQHIACAPHELLNKYITGVSTGMLHHMLVDNWISLFLTNDSVSLRCHQLDFVWVKGCSYD